MDGSTPASAWCCDPAALARETASFIRLEAEITELWGHLNAATYRFLTLLAEFDRNKAYERHGLVNSAQWLNWQCGIGMLAAREKVRTARALERLPLIAASFARGEISYSKVRAMTRVATAANEDVLLNVALHGTASHVEKLVRKYRWTQRRDAAKEAQAHHLERYVRCFFDETGALVLNAYLPAEVGMLVRKALEAASDALRADSATDGNNPQSSAPRFRLGRMFPLKPGRSRGRIPRPARAAPMRCSCSRSRSLRAAPTRSTSTRAPSAIKSSSTSTRRC